MEMLAAHQPHVVLPDRRHRAQYHTAKELSQDRQDFALEL